MTVLLRDRAFWVALGVGAALALAVTSVAPARRRVGAGAVMTLGVVAGLLASSRAPASLLAGLALLAIGGGVTARRAEVWQIAAAVPGAVVLGASAASGRPTWVGVAAGAVTVGASPLLAELDRHAPRLTGLLAAISAGGVFGSTPDTEHARALVGGALAGILRSADPQAVSGAAGAASLAGMLTWTAAVDGYGRPGAVVGALGCVGVFALAPLVVRARDPAPVVVAVHLGLVGVSSRVAGFEHAAGSALVIVVAAFVAAAVALWLLRARDVGARRADPRR
ncbi:MAG TPA: hypothetical protein VGU73_12550 [Acidimicrobiia bacterium]|nr:hypothetical protein [Acidimicrobiia bacterium]